MIKKYLVCIICIICVFTSGFSAFAQSDTSTVTDETVQEQMPVQGGMGGRGGGRRGGMDGQMPENMTPPESGEAMPRPDDFPRAAGNEATQNGEQPTPPQSNDQMAEEIPQSEENFPSFRDDNAAGHEDMQMPDDGNRWNMMPERGNLEMENQADINNTSKNSGSLMNFVTEYQTPIISVVLLLAAFIFVKLYKRKNF